MSQPQDGMITFEEFKDMEKFKIFAEVMNKQGTAAICDNETRHPVFIITDLRPGQPLKEEFLKNDPLNFGFTLTRRFIELYGEKALMILNFKDKAIDLLAMLEKTSEAAHASIDESFNHMKDLLSQMSDFNNV